MIRISKALPLLLATTVLSPSGLLQAASTKANEQAGANLFREKGCAYCHGPSAQGTPKGPSLDNLRKKMKATEIAGQIENGGQKMPSFGDSLSHDEVTQLVVFLRAKHRPPIPAASQPAPGVQPLINPAQ